MSDDGWFAMDLVGCARCHGEGHPQLVFKAFLVPAEVGGIKLTHWAVCPETSEPILYASIETP